MSDTPSENDAPSVGPPEVPAASRNLEAALAHCGLQLLPPQVQLLDQYFRLRSEWNERMNLTRHDTFDLFVARDVLDTLSFARVLQPDEVVLDVGTGGGVPGVVLAVLRPDLHVFVCESVGKRAQAVADIISRLGLPIPVLAGRAESFLAAGGWMFNSLLIRAVAPLLDLMRWFQPYWETFDRLLVLKGPKWTEERGEARHYGVMHGFALRVMDHYLNPDTQAESVLLQICPEERLVVPKGCQLRKIVYEKVPQGLVSAVTSGPLPKKNGASPGQTSEQAASPAGTKAKSRSQKMGGMPRTHKAGKKSMKHFRGKKGGVYPSGKAAESAEKNTKDARSGEKNANRTTTTDAEKKDTTQNIGKQQKPPVTGRMGNRRGLGKKTTTQGSSKRIRRKTFRRRKKPGSAEMD